MYFLLLACQMNLAVMGTVTPDFSTQTPLSHSEHQSTEMHTQAITSLGHIPLTKLETMTQKVATDHKVSEHQSTEMHTQVITTQSHIPLTKLETMTQKVATDHKVSGLTETEKQTMTQKVATDHKVSESLSMPNVSIIVIDNKVHIKCICEHGPEVIDYELLLGDQIVKNKTVHRKEAAIFQFNITRGSSHLYCRARTSSGEEATSQPLKIVGDHPESEDKPGDQTKPDKEERDAGPKFLIPLTDVLTSVSQQVQDINIIIISTCGSILLVLLLVITLKYFCDRRGQKVPPRPLL